MQHPDHLKKADFPYTGFTTYWYFEDPDAVGYEEYFIDHMASPQICEDIKKVLLTLKKHELLIPTYVLCDPQKKFEINAVHIEDFVAEVETLIEQGKIDTEINIGGYGVVYDENNEPLIQEDLISIDGIRFFQRQLFICSTKGIWVPLAIDVTYEMNWQVELARNNCFRLEACLQEIHAALGIKMSPAAGEIDRDNPIWIQGYKPYNNPETLLSHYKYWPPSQPFDLNEFLVEQ